MTRTRARHRELEAEHVGCMAWQRSHSHTTLCQQCAWMRGACTHERPSVLPLQPEALSRARRVPPLHPPSPLIYLPIAHKALTTKDTFHIKHWQIWTLCK